MDTTLSDASTTITQTEVILTKVQREAKKVTNLDYGHRFHFRDRY